MLSSILTLAVTAIISSYGNPAINPVFAAVRNSEADKDPQRTPSMLTLSEEEPRVLTMTITAYSSSADETDSSPTITASNTRVHDGVVATNALPFGTRVRIPSLFGDKEFVVEDRMHYRFKDRLDIWFPSKAGAIKFGVKTGVPVEVLPENA